MYQFADFVLGIGPKNGGRIVNDCHNRKRCPVTHKGWLDCNGRRAHCEGFVKRL